MCTSIPPKLHLQQQYCAKMEFWRIYQLEKWNLWGKRFQASQLLKGHKEAVDRTLVLSTCTEDVGETSSSEQSVEKFVSREDLLSKILSKARFLAWQALLLQGDNAGEINFKFQQWYCLRAENNPFLNDWMKPNGDKYTSKDIHNKMMKVLMLQVFQQIAAEICSADFFITMIDKATNVANIAQLTLCISWVDNNLDSNKDLIALHSLDIANPDTIVTVIKDVILWINFNSRNYRGQCYDGCSTVKGEKIGVTKQIKSKESKAFLTQCFTLLLNSAVGNNITVSKWFKTPLKQRPRSQSF